MKLGATLPYLQLDVSERGVAVSAAPGNDNPRFEQGPYAIDCVSYGVQGPAHVTATLMHDRSCYPK